MKRVLIATAVVLTASIAHAEHIYLTCDLGKHEGKERHNSDFGPHASVFELNFDPEEERFRVFFGHSKSVKNEKNVFRYTDDYYSFEWETESFSQSLILNRANGNIHSTYELFNNFGANNFSFASGHCAIKGKPKF